MSHNSFLKDLESTNPLIDAKIVVAQEEAEKEAAFLESINDEEELLPSVPKLLQLPKYELVEKTYELKAKGQQLDLLLLKAESYSHFIAENQRRSIISNLSSNEILTPIETSKRKGHPDKSNSKKSKLSLSSSSSTSSSLATDNIDSSTLFQQPPNLTGGSLLPYQLEGLQWLLSLWENGLSGILADEMVFTTNEIIIMILLTFLFIGLQGLGKTIQVISLIAHLRHSNTTGPFLIAAPLATIPNWVNEFQKWLPSCPVITYHGSKPEREQVRRDVMQVSNQKSLTFPVVITSFEICMIDRSFLERYTWQVILIYFIIHVDIPI
jgi:ATP-dependent DNA helicase